MKFCKMIFGLFVMALMVVISAQTDNNGAEMMAGAMVLTIDPFAAAKEKFHTFLSEMQIPNAVVTRNSLQVAQLVKNNQGEYEFDLEYNSATDTPSENKLKKNNFFLVAGISLGLQNTSGDADDNKIVYDGKTGFAAAHATQLQNFYNGKIKIVTDNSDRTDTILTNLLQAPSDDVLIDEKIYKLYACPVLNGDVSNKVRVQLGAGTKDSIAGTTAGDTRVVVQLHGFSYTGIDDAAGTGRCQTT